MITLPIWLFIVILFAICLFAMFLMAVLTQSKINDYEITINTLENKLRDIKLNYKAVNDDYIHLSRVHDMVNTVIENTPDIKKQSKN